MIASLQGNVVPLEEAPRRDWLELIKNDPQASPLTHPDVAHPDGTLVYQAGDREHLTALGVLAPWRVGVAATEHLRRLFRLNGHRLLGDQVIGQHSPEIAADFIDRVCDLLDAGRSQAVLIEDLEARSPLWHAAQEAARAGRLSLHEPSPPQAHWTIELPEPAADYWSQFSAKRRGNLKRAVKKLDHVMVVHRAPADVPRFIQDAEAVSRRSWQGKRLGLRVHEGRTRELTALAELGALRAYVLHVQGRPVAFLLGMQQGTRFIVDEIAYDRELAEFSPGTVTLYRCLEDLIDHDTPRTVDFGAGHADYKALFGNHQEASGPLVLVARKPRPQLVLALSRAAAAAERSLRQLLRRAGLYERLRRAYRGGAAATG